MNKEWQPTQILSKNSKNCSKNPVLSVETKSLPSQHCKRAPPHHLLACDEASVFLCSSPLVVCLSWSCPCPCLCLVSLSSPPTHNNMGHKKLVSVKATPFFMCFTRCAVCPTHVQSLSGKTMSWLYSFYDETNQQQHLSQGGANPNGVRDQLCNGCYFCCLPTVHLLLLQLLLLLLLLQSAAAAAVAVVVANVRFVSRKKILLR